MTKEKKGITITPWWKTFLTSILGTTISIALTFGTSTWVSSSKKRAAQMQTAMMVIHDVDVSVGILEKMADDEEKQMQAVQYISAHSDQIDSLPIDTLRMAMRLLFRYDSDGVFFDDSKEKIFNSSQDTWDNLDNVSFVDNMERFYRSRNYVKTMLVNSPQWKKPISESDYYEISLQSSNADHSLNFSAVLKEKLSDPHVKYYVDYSHHRIRTLHEYANAWRDLSERNKFLMNISDEELVAFIKNSKRSGESVEKNDIIGMWEFTFTGTDIQYYDFQKSSTFRREMTDHITNPFYSGDIIVTLSLGGTWYIKGDSLILKYSPETAEAQVDRSNITYAKEMQDSVDSYINRWFQVNQLKESLRNSFKTDTFCVSINKARNKIEMIMGHNGGLEESINIFYLKRRKNPR